MTHPSPTTTSINADRLHRAGNGNTTFASTSDPADQMMVIAQRLLSETAHDLRTPLVAVRQSLRALGDGQLGDITGDQRGALLGAIHSCSDMQELIDNMLRLEGLRSGVPRVHRRWIDAASIAQSLAATVRSAGIDKDVSVLWDRPASAHHLLYADSDKLRRLLLNLIRNAIRATPVGGQVLVRTSPVETRGTLQFAVSDRGRSTPPNQLRRLAVEGSSALGETGLEWAISRQMAALHFGHLHVTSRPELGTRVTFEVPSAGPSAVADSWCRWRELFQSSRRRPLRRGLHFSEGKGGDSGPTNSDSSVDTIVLTHEGAAPQHPDSLTVLSLQLADTTPADLASQMDQRLQEGLRMYELAYRASERRWVMLWDSNSTQALERIAATNHSIAASLPNVGLSWSKAIQLPIGGRSTRASLRDLLVRDTLGAGKKSPVGDDRRMTIGNAAAATGAPDAVSRRLDAELRFLTNRLTRQHTRMQQQAAAIRPPNSL